MVLETLLSPKKAERRPWEMFFVALLYSSVAILLSLWVFKEYASLVMVFLTVLASAHIMHGAISLEEKKDKEIKSERFLLKEHSRVLSFFMFLFLGFVISFSLWYVFLPENITAFLFKAQISIIGLITAAAVSGSAVLITIFLNNLKVLLFSLLFAFFYGVGAIFILTWNASVIGTAIGSFVQNVGYFSALIRYLTHGLPEILAYFMVGLAAGIISIAVIRHDFRSGKFKHILIDSIDLIILAVLILFVAALIEVYVTPMFF